MQTPPAIVPAAEPQTISGADAIRLALDLPRAKFSDEDLKAAAQLPAKAREDMMMWLKLLEPVMPLFGKVRVQHIQAHLAKLARRTGKPLVTVRRRYDALRKSGWRGLVNRSLAGPTWYDRNMLHELTVAERPAFVDFWRSVMEQFQGRDQTGRAAHSKLLRQLDAWEHGDEKARIPGYDLPPPRDRFTGLPAGWSYDNLMEYKPAVAELMGAKYGRGALADFRLPILSTREGLRVGQVVFFDDQDYDVRVNFLGVAKQSFRPCGFNALDCLSAKQALQGYKPVLVDEATGRRRKLTEQDFRWFVVAYLTTVGYRRDTGTVFVVEHGTAAIRAEFEDRITTATQGLVKVDRGGIAGQPAYAGMFEGQARGNFRFKAALESSFVRVRNEMAALPGSVGKDRDHAPEGDVGLDRYNQKLLNVLAVRPDLRDRLMFPILDWRQFIETTMEIYRLIDARTEHDLEGWERCGHIAHEYRLSLDSQEWIDAVRGFAGMNEQQRAAICAHVESEPGLWRTRKLSPREVWDAGKGDLVTVPDHALPVLMGPDDARYGERCEMNNLFVLKDRGIDAEPMHYDASALVRMGRVEPGKTYSVFLNPFAPQKLVVCDQALRYIGTAHFYDRIERLDYAEAARRIAHAKREEAPTLANLSRRGATKTRQMEEMRRNNAEAITGRTLPAPARSARGTVQIIPASSGPVHDDDDGEDVALLLGGSFSPSVSTPAAKARPDQPENDQAEGDDLGLIL